MLGAILGWGARKRVWAEWEAWEGGAGVWGGLAAPAPYLKGREGEGGGAGAGQRHGSRPGEGEARLTSQAPPDAHFPQPPPRPVPG